MLVLPLGRIDEAIIPFSMHFPAVFLMANPSGPHIPMSRLARLLIRPRPSTRSRPRRLRGHLGFASLALRAKHSGRGRTAGMSHTKSASDFLVVTLSRTTAGWFCTTADGHFLIASLNRTSAGGHASMVILSGCFAGGAFLSVNQGQWRVSARCAAVNLIGASVDLLGMAVDGLCAPLKVQCLAGALRDAAGNCAPSKGVPPMRSTASVSG